MADLTTTELTRRLNLLRRQITGLLSSGAIGGRDLPFGAWLAGSESVARYETGQRRGVAASSTRGPRGRCSGSSRGSTRTG